MDLRVRHRALFAIAAAVALFGAAVVGAQMLSGSKSSAKVNKFSAREFEGYSQGVENGGAGGESAEALTAAQQWAEARLAPGGIVAPGAYTSAFNQLTGLPATGGSWTD